MNLLFFLKPKNYVTYLTLDSTLRQGLEKMRNSGYTEIPVIDKDGLYAGTVRQGDFLWKILDNGYTDIRETENETIRAIVSRRILPVHIDTAMDELLTKSMDQNFVPVIDDLDSFVGIITRRDIIKYFIEKNGSTTITAANFSSSVQPVQASYKR